MSRTVAYGSLIILGLMILGCLGPMFLFEIPFYLLAGWAFFAARALPEVKVDWGGVALAVVCLAVMAGLTHSFLRWIYGSIDDGATWKWRWTASILAVVVLMFAAGTAATGMAHQTGWLLTSKERWISGGIARERAQSVGNLRQIGLAMTNYSESFGSLPAAATVDAEGRLLHGWQARILPYLDHQELYNQIDFSRPWDDSRNEATFRIQIRGYLNPAIPLDREARGPAPSHYSGNVLILGGDSARKLNEISDGTSNTFLAGEVADHFRPWGHPANWRDPALGLNQSPDGFGGPFPGGANFLIADGSIRFLKNTVDPKVFRAIGTPAGGDQVNPDSY